MKNSQKKQHLSTSAAMPGVAVAAIPAAALLRPNAADLAGDSASRTTLDKLEQAAAELKSIQIVPFLHQSVNCIRAEDPQGACEWALKALQLDERNGIAWRMMGIGREKLGDFGNAIACYEAALPALPDHGEIANDIGRLAYRLDQKPLAARLFAHFYESFPEIPDGANNLACVLRDEGQGAEAIEILKGAIGRHTDNAMLWNTLGTVLCEQGEHATALTFFGEALRLDPAFAKARYNLGNTRLLMGDLDNALIDCEAAFGMSSDPSELAMIRLARSTIRHCRGEIAAGWDDYEARLDPYFADQTRFLIERPLWTPNADLAGKHLLLYGEQGLGDEVLFANTVPDLIEALGPDGKLTIAVEPRLVSLFQRSFPSAKVGAHATYKVDAQTVRGAPFVDDLDKVDLWTPMASLLRRFRASADAFPGRAGYLTADPDRVAHWREVLKGAPAGSKVGVLWKSMRLTGSRNRAFSPFEQWAPVLKTPGVCFVNLQYGDCAEEIALAKRGLGVDLWTPPGIDLKNDLDDLAALTLAMDLVVGFPNATLNIAGAAGAKVWMINAANAWTLLGERDRHLWYPQAQLFTRQVEGDWSGTMERVARELAAL